MLALLLAALAAPLLAPYDPAEQLDPVASSYRPPGTELAAVHLADGSWRLADRARRTSATVAGLLAINPRRTAELSALHNVACTRRSVASLGTRPVPSPRAISA